MNKIIETIKGAAAGIALASMLLVGLAPVAAHAADTYNVSGNPFNPISGPKSYAAGITNSTSLATNGQYTAAIGSTTTTTGTETNLVPLNANFASDFCVLSVSGQALLANNGSTGSTNVVFVLSSLPRGQRLTITNNAQGWASSATPRSYFGSFTMTLQGTTLMASNFVFSPNSTPPFNRNLTLYLESIQANVSTNYFTNWSATIIE